MSSVIVGRRRIPLPVPAAGELEALHFRLDALADDVEFVDEVCS